MFLKISTVLEKYAEKYFFIVLSVLISAYFVLNYFYLKRMPLIMDEYSGAWWVYQFTQGVPYVDFMPYKTIIGYYIQLPALMLPGDIWSRLIYVKAEMVLINGACIFFAAHMLTRHFRRLAILFSTLYFLTMSNFLEHGNSLRVDMLTAWFGLFSFLFLLRDRYGLAGLLLAASFLTSQKGIYYTAATIAAMCLSQFIKHDRPKFKQWFILGAAAALPVAAYGFLFAAFGAKIKDIVFEVVAAHKDVALGTLYQEKTMASYWTQTTDRNPFFYAAATLGILSFIRAVKNGSRVAAICFAYGVTVFGCCLWHKQPWPYFFVLLIPTAWILIVGLFETVNSSPTKSIVLLLWLVGIGGAVYPLQRIPTVLAHSNKMQRNTVALASMLVGKHEYYLAGIAMLFDRKQHPKLTWLDWKAIAYAGQYSEQILNDIKKKTPKLVIDNYRVRWLQGPLREYLDANYAMLRGNIHLYCPSVKPRSFAVAFDGNYTVQIGKRKAAAYTLNRKKIAVGKTVSLKKNAKLKTGAGGYRLCLKPPAGWKSVVSKKYQKTDEFLNPYDW
jgi:hypothetical protein